MAKRPSIKEIMEAARKGGAAKPGDDVPVAIPSEEVAETAALTEASESESRAVEEPRAVAPAAVPSAQSLGRPLTMKEKLAAARSGAAPVAAAPSVAPSAGAGEKETETETVVAKAKPVPAAAASLGRPLTMAEKLAAARGGASAPAASPSAAGPKPAVTKSVAAKAVSAKRELPPLGELSDPKDLAEAARQAGAKKVAADQPVVKTAAAKPSKEKDSKPQTVLPRPAKAMAMARNLVHRREFVMLFSWVAVGWISFIAGSVAFTAMMGRFMFPNVLAEPPSTIKVGLPTNFEPEEVNDRFKAEWGFWIVRSTRYNGEDIIYALQSVCTHLGCPPNWLAGEQKFKCPCHGSGFYISGVNFEGPAPRPLERFKVTTGEDGQMVVDKSTKFQDELGQWSDPTSFITA